MTQHLFVIASGDHAMAAGGDITVNLAFNPCPRCEQRLLAEGSTLCRECQTQQQRETIIAVIGGFLTAWLVAFGLLSNALDWAGIELSRSTQGGISFALVMAVAAAHALGLHLRLQGWVVAGLRKGGA